MNIIIATSLYPPEIENLATYTKALTQHLKDKHNVFIVAYASVAVAIPNTTILTVSKKLPLPLRILKYIITLLKTARHADVIYVQNAVAAGLPAIIVQRLLKIPVILNFAEDEAWKNACRLRQTNKYINDFLETPEGNLKIRFIMFLQGFVLRRAKIVTVPSKKFAKAVIRSYRLPKERVFANYSPPEKEEIVPFPARVIPRQIVAIACLNEWSGIIGIIHATALLVKKIHDLRLIIAGEGPEEKKLKILVNKLGLNNNVDFLGYVSRAESWYICKCSQVYALNPANEYSPRSVQKGFAANIPIVAPNIPCFNEMIKDGESGILVSPGDNNKFAEAIFRLFKNQILCENITKKAQETLKEKFSWPAHIKKLYYLFNLVAGDKK